MEKEVKDALLLEVKEQVKTLLDEGAIDKKSFNTLTEAVKALETKETIDVKTFNLLKEEHIQLMKDAKAAAENPISRDVKDMSVKAQYKSFIESNKDRVEAFKRCETKSLSIPLDLKAPAIMTVGTNVGGSGYLPTREIVPSYNTIARRRPFLEDAANTSTTNSPNIVWVNMLNKEGNAAFVGEGVLKPLIDWEFATENSVAKKVAARTKVSNEMLDDVDFMSAAIENELRYEVDLAVDIQLLTGNGVGANLKGIGSTVGGYVLTTIKTTTPNNFDAIRAAIGQITSLNFNPTAVFINPIDAANMDLVKDTQGRPLSMEYRMNGTIYRLTPYESNGIPVGSVLVGDMTKLIIRNYKPFEFRIGWENDDFSKNLVSMIGERRLHVYIPANHIGAFVYDTFATIKTAML